MLHSLSHKSTLSREGFQLLPLLFKFYASRPSALNACTSSDSDLDPCITLFDIYRPALLRFSKLWNLQSVKLAWYPFSHGHPVLVPKISKQKHPIYPFPSTPISHTLLDRTEASYPEPCLSPTMSLYDWFKGKTLYFFSNSSNNSIKSQNVLPAEEDAPVPRDSASDRAETSSGDLQDIEQLLDGHYVRSIFSLPYLSSRQ